ncbi:MAG: hypothetical protein R2698_07120 [Microthrixaceae bacterium]
MIAAAFEARQLAFGRVAHRLGEVACVQPPAIRDRAVVIAAVVTELLADSGELLAQHELALGLLQSLTDLGTDPACQLDLGQCLLDPTEDQLEAVGQPERLEEFDLALDGEVGPPARCVDEGRGVVEAPQHTVETRAELFEQRTERRPQLHCE